MFKLIFRKNPNTVANYNTSSYAHKIRRKTQLNAKTNSTKQTPTEAVVINDHQFIVRSHHRHHRASNAKQLQLNASDGEDADNTTVSCRSKPVCTDTDHLQTPRTAQCIRDHNEKED